MLVQTVFPCANDDRSGEAKRSSGIATHAHDLHTVDGLRARPTDIADTDIRYTCTVTCDGEMVGQRIVIPQHAVHGDQTAVHAGVITVDGEIITHTVVQTADLQRTAVDDIAVDGIGCRGRGCVVARYRIPGRQHATTQDIDIVVNRACAGEGSSVLNRDGGRVTSATQGRAFSNQGCAAFQLRISGIAVVADQRQRIGIGFFDVAAARDIGCEGGV